ncbi:MAG: dihydroorotate dehydrogenase electron transfer subunit [bacterium]|jgi:dihydroorotate dehydrogenase electron transfer subunit
MKYCIRAAILENERIGDSYYLMKLDVGRMASDCNPGEFIHLRSLAADWPFLRRPFSIYSSDGEGTIEIVYKVVGKATSLMSDAIPGDVFDVMGPLGRPFNLGAGASRVIAVGGGVGIPPLVFFCRRYAAALDEMHLIVGAKTSAEIIVPVSLIVEGVRVTYYTEDGSKGEEGLVTDGLGPALEKAAGGGLEVIACGPRGMLAEVARAARHKGVKCQVSVEEIMACGVGACLSCAVPGAGGGYLHACKDGPVFDSEAIDWERWTCE